VPWLEEDPRSSPRGEPRALRHGLDCLCGFFDDLADLRLADDQRRGENERVAGGAQKQIAFAEGVFHGGETAHSAGARLWRKINRRVEAGIADILDIGEPAQAMDGAGQNLLKNVYPCKEAFLFVNIERSEARGAANGWPEKAQPCRNSVACSGPPMNVS
jgi:hypothetical protein